MAGSAAAGWHCERQTGAEVRKALSGVARRVSRRKHSKLTGPHLEPAAAPGPREKSSPSKWPLWKLLLSGVLVVHLLAVVAEPFRFFTRSRRGTSPAADPARLGLAPYIEFAYLNHGYFFFAPEPGPSHLMEFRMAMPDKRQVSLVLPDKTRQWPRLLYHRHFMLAEFLHQLHVPPLQPEVVGDDERFARDWQAERALYERVRDSMTQHVAANYGAEQVQVERLEHRLPSDDEVFRLRLPLNAPELYLRLPDDPLDVPPPEPLPAAAAHEEVRP